MSLLIAITTHRRRLLIGVVAALLLLAGCSLPTALPQPSATPADVTNSTPDAATTVAAVPIATTIPLAAVEGITWRLLSLAGRPLASDNITLVFDSRQISGSSGCNSYAANFTLADGALTLGPLNGTARACDTGMEAETSYLNSLATAERLVLDGEQLTIVTEQGNLVYGKVAPIPAGALIGGWQLEAFSSGAMTTSLVGNSTISADFTADTLSGSTGCNLYSATYTLTGDALVLSPIATTAMACEAAIAGQEQIYLTALESVGRITIEGDRLTISHAGGTLQFSRAAATLPLNLPQTSWRLLGTPDPALLPMAGAPISLTFGDDQISGVSGCNNYGASYTVSGSQLQVGTLVQTEMVCSDDLMAVERAYLATLQQAIEIRRSEATLIIGTSSGDLTFSQLDGPTAATTPAATPGATPDAEATTAAATPTPTPRSGLAPTTGESLAIFENYRVEVTYPPLQGFVIIEGTFPNNCTRITRSEQMTDGDGTILYNIYVVRPADTPCQPVATPFEQAFDLDLAGLGSGTYTIEVNGSRGTFRLTLGN